MYFKTVWDFSGTDEQKELQKEAAPRRADEVRR